MSESRQSLERQIWLKLEVLPRQQIVRLTASALCTGTFTHSVSRASWLKWRLRATANQRSPRDLRAKKAKMG